MDWAAAKRALLEGQRVRSPRWLPGVSISQEQGRVVEHREGFVPRITVSHIDDDPFLAELTYEAA